MKIAKKILALLLSVLMIGAMAVVFTACGDKKEEKTKSKKYDESTSDTDKGEKEDDAVNDGLTKAQKKVINKMEDAINDHDGWAYCEVAYPTALLEAAKEDFEEYAGDLEEEMNGDYTTAAGDNLGTDWTMTFEVTSVEKMSEEDLADFQEEIEYTFSFYDVECEEVEEALWVDLKRNVKSSEGTDEVEVEDRPMYKYDGEWHMIA